MTRDRWQRGQTGLVTGPRSHRAGQGAVQAAPREEERGPWREESSVSSEEEECPCLTGPQGTGKVETVARVWVNRRAPRQSPPVGPGLEPGVSTRPGGGPAPPSCCV